NEAERGKAAVEPPLDPVIGCAAPVMVLQDGIPGGDDIKLVALQEDSLQAEEHRAVRIALAIGEYVVLAVNGHPLAGHRTRAEPQPEAEYVAHHGMQLDRIVSLLAVQE